MNRPSPNLARTPEQYQSPSDKASPAAAIFHVWVTGMRVFGRFLWFSFFLIILMAPFNMAATFTKAEDRSLFSADGFNSTAGMLLIAFAIYMPFAAYFAARWSKQLLGTNPSK